MVPNKNEAKYLGCMINDKGDPVREIKKRLTECYIVWKKLGDFFLNSGCNDRLLL